MQCNSAQCLYFTECFLPTSKLNLPQGSIKISSQDHVTDSQDRQASKPQYFLYS